MNEEPTTPGLLLSYEGNMKGIRVINNHVLPTSWDINIDFYTRSIENEDNSTHTIESTVSFLVLTHWINELMQDVIVFDPQDEFAISWAPMTYNPSVTTPGQPTDDLFSRVIMRKIQKLVGNRLEIVKLSVLSEDGGGMKYTYFGTPSMENMLPDISYVGTINETTKLPWWERKTAECYDLPDDTEIPGNVTELYTHHEDSLTEYEDAMRERYSELYANPIEKFAQQLINKLKDVSEGKEKTDKIIEFPTKKPKNE